MCCRRSCENCKASCASRAGWQPCGLRLSTTYGAVETRRLGGQRQAYLPAVCGGGSDRANEKAEGTSAAAARGAGIGAAAGPEVVDGLRGAASAGRALDPCTDGGRPVHARVRDAAGRQHVEWREGRCGLGQGAVAARSAGVDHRGRTEFTSKALDHWAYRNGVHLDFIRPERPVENGYIESFNAKLRDECLNLEVFFNLADARRKLYLWRRDYNHQRPHSALDDRTPAEFAATATQRDISQRPCLRHSLELQ